MEKTLGRQVHEAVKMKQLHLFDPATKRNDPATSCLAEKHMVRTGSKQRHMLLLAKAVHEHPGYTSHELSQFIPAMTPMQCQRRIHDAKSNHYIEAIGSRRCTVRNSKTACEIYGPTHAADVTIRSKP